MFTDYFLKQITNSWTHNPASRKIIYPGEMEKLKQTDKKLFYNISTQPDAVVSGDLSLIVISQKIRK